MCYSRLYDVITVAVSLLFGVALGILSYLGLVTPGVTVPLIALGLGLFALAAAAWGRAHGLRCRAQGARLVAAAILLAAAAVLWLVFASAGQIFTLVITFVSFGLMAYVFMNLFCFLTCREKEPPSAVPYC